MTATVIETVTIRAPPERVFAYRLDVTTLPEYNPDVRDLVPLTDGGPGRGCRYRFRVRLMPGMSVRATLAVEEVDPPGRVVFEIASLTSAREVCTFTPAGEGTLVRFETTMRTPNWLLGRLIDRWFVIPIARRQTVQELMRMKERLER